jgi:hypothetical protein
MPLQPWQLSSSLLHAFEGKHVDMVSQSCQQHIPAGAGVVVVVHSSSQCATHAAKTVGLVGHALMHADRVPPVQPLGAGLGAGVGAAVVVTVVTAGQSCLHTEMHISYASPVTTEHAATQAPIDPPGQSPEGDGDGGLGVGDGGLGPGDGGGEGVGVGPVVVQSHTFGAPHPVTNAESADGQVLPSLQH